MEEWRDIPGYEGMYQVSNNGRVKSLPRERNNARARWKSKEKILKPGYGGFRYAIVALLKGKKQKTHKVHSLVAQAFLNHEPCGLKVVVDHIDNDPTNNNLENLQLITHRLNCSKNIIGSASKYVGVTRSKELSKWRAQIRHKNKLVHLGYFTNEKEAAQAYQQALKEIQNGSSPKPELHIPSRNSPETKMDLFARGNS